MEYILSTIPSTAQTQRRHTLKQEPIKYDEIIDNLSPDTLEVLGTILSNLNNRRDRSPWYTLKEAAEYMRCGVTKIRSLIEECRLKSHRIDPRLDKSTIVIHRKDMDALLLFERCRGLLPREQKLLKFMQS